MKRYVVVFSLVFLPFKGTKVTIDGKRIDSTDVDKDGGSITSMSYSLEKATTENDEVDMHLEK